MAGQIAGLICKEQVVKEELKRCLIFKEVIKGWRICMSNKIAFLFPGQGSSICGGIGKKGIIQ